MKLSYQLSKVTIKGRLIGVPGGLLVIPAGTRSGPGQPVQRLIYGLMAPIVRRYIQSNILCTIMIREQLFLLICELVLELEYYNNECQERMLQNIPKSINLSATLEIHHRNRNDNYFHLAIVELLFLIFPFQVSQIGYEA